MKNLRGLRVQLTGFTCTTYGVYVYNLRGLRVQKGF